MNETLVAKARGAFCRRFSGGPPTGVAVAPGRINLIGDHTDYNDGFVLPMAIDRYLAVAFGPRDDAVIRAYAAATDQEQAGPLDSFVSGRAGQWFDYVKAMAWVLTDAGHQVQGANLAIVGDIPIGAGLASSAALELAVARALCAGSQLDWDAVVMAKLGQRAENEFVGVACGLMDQFTVASAVSGHALLLDCRSLVLETVPLPATAVFVVLDTGSRRSLTATAYNQRQASCSRAVKSIGRAYPQVRSLRDVDQPMLDACCADLGETTCRRVRHVVAENTRPPRMAAALRSGDLRTAGCLMNDSHASLRDLYEVSSPELDLITDLARAAAGCFGARLTGAGFGGCAVALVARDAAAQFCTDVQRAYRSRSSLPGELFRCTPASGADLVSA